MRSRPNLIIIRIPEDNEGNKQFLEVGVNDDLTLDFENAMSFHVHDGDSYNLLSFNEIVLAERSADSSIELARVEIVITETQQPTAVHNDLVTLTLMVPTLINEYLQGFIKGFQPLH